MIINGTKAHLDTYYNTFYLMRRKEKFRKEKGVPILDKRNTEVMIVGR